MVSRKTPDERRAAIKSQIEKLDAKIAKKKENIQKHVARREKLFNRIQKKYDAAEKYDIDHKTKMAMIDEKINKIRTEIEKHEAQKVKLQAKHDAVKDKAAPKEKKPHATRKAPKLVIVETESVESAPKEKKHAEKKPRAKKAAKAEAKPAEKKPRTKKAAKAEAKPVEKKPRAKKAPKEKVNKAPALAKTAEPADVPLAPALPPMNTTQVLAGAVKKSRTKSAKKSEDVALLAQNLIDIQEVTKKNVGKKIKDMDEEIKKEASREGFSQEDVNARERRIDELKKDRKVLVRARGLLKKK